MLDDFLRPGKASFIVGGQFGSEGKGAAAAFVASQLAVQDKAFDIITTNAGAQAGHTSTHDGIKRVVFHLPTASLIDPMRMRYDELKDEMRPMPPVTYLNAGSVIDPIGLERELYENSTEVWPDRFFIHPNAAVITDACREAEMRDDSAQTKIASTRKGVGEALSRKVLRSGMIAAQHPFLSKFVRKLDLTWALKHKNTVLVEVPQGVSLSVDGPFYPHTTSRNCTVQQAMSDAGIHPHFYGASMLVLRTFPIRVGNIEQQSTMLDAKTSHMLGHSGGVYFDQAELSWEDIGVEAEITTVTKRVRRVFTWSDQQAIDAISSVRPTVVYLTFCDYLPSESMVRVLVQRLRSISNTWGLNNGCEIICQFGPTTADWRVV